MGLICMMESILMRRPVQPPAFRRMRVERRSDQQKAVRGEAWARAGGAELGPRAEWLGRPSQGATQKFRTAVGDGTRAGVLPR